MLKLLAFVISYVCFVEIKSQDTYCSYVLNKSCAHEQRDAVCATDGITYRNRCEYAKAYCNDKSVHISSYGDCSKSTTEKPIQTPPRTTKTTKTTITSSKPFSGSGIVLDIVCLDLNYIQCPVGGTPISGSDGKLYENACKFYKRTCHHRELQYRNGGC